MLFHDRIYDLQRRFLRIIAVGLGAHEDLFESMLPNGSTLTRAIRYPPMPEAPEGEPHVWAGEHADINLITALPRATAAGPAGEDRRRAGSTPSPPRAGSIINTGMMLERALQRADPAGLGTGSSPTDGQAGERYSVVQFCHPTPWTVLVPAAVVLHAGAPPALRAPIEAGDKLDEVLYEINLVEDARRV